jgi:hypothetical protein
LSFHFYLLLFSLPWLYPHIREDGWMIAITLCFPEASGMKNPWVTALQEGQGNRST